MPQIPPIQFEGFNSGIPWAILTSKSPGYPYNKEGTRQSDTPEKWRYGVALPGNRYTPLTISIEGSTDFLSNITDEQIAEACASLQPFLVRFDNCYVSIFTIKGEQRMTATASGVELVKPSK